MAEDNVPQSVIVTGAARRIGRAIALHLARKGWHVLLHYHRSHEEAVAVCEEIRTLGVDAHPVSADLRDPSAAETIFRAAAGLPAPVTCLVNNASLFEQDGIDTLDLDTWDAHINTNLRAPVLLAAAFARALPENMRGNIVNMIDQKVWRPTPKFFSYTIAKSALWTANRTMAQALAPRIRVNGIGPGPTLRNSHQTDDDFARQAASVPLERGASTAEICDAVDFILAAGTMTGQMIALDGGQHLAWQTPDVTDARE